MHVVKDKMLVDYGWRLLIGKSVPHLWPNLFVYNAAQFFESELIIQRQKPKARTCDKKLFLALVKPQSG